MAAGDNTTFGRESCCLESDAATTAVGFRLSNAGVLACVTVVIVLLSSCSKQVQEKIPAQVREMSGRLSGIELTHEQLDLVDGIVQRYSATIYKARHRVPKVVDRVTIQRRKASEAGLKGKELEVATFAGISASDKSAYSQFENEVYSFRREVAMILTHDQRTQCGLSLGSDGNWKLLSRSKEG